MSMIEHSLPSGSLSRRNFLKLFFCATLSPTAHPSPDFYFRRSDPRAKQVVFTFDDGWDPKSVESTVETLQSLGIPADFFPVGRVIMQYPYLWRDVAKAGFPLHNHTYSHADLSATETDREFQIKAWEEAYVSLGLGKYPNPKVLRLPQNRGEGDLWLYGLVNRLGYAGIAGWTIDSPGYRPGWDSRQVIEHVTRLLVPGAILLFHFISDDIKALPAIADAVHKAELTPVSLDKAVGLPTFQSSRTTPRTPLS